MIVGIPEGPRLESERIEMRGLNLRTEATAVAKAQVVGDDNQKVRTSGSHRGVLSSSEVVTGLGNLRL